MAVKKGPGKLNAAAALEKKAQRAANLEKAMGIEKEAPEIPEENRKKVRMNIMLYPDHKKILQDEAAKRRTSPSEIIRELIEEKYL